MTVVFTDEEKKYLVIGKGNWSISEKCPHEIKKKIEAKIKMMEDYEKMFEKAP